MEGFSSPPAHWMTLAGAPAQAPARGGRLELEGDAAFVDTRSFAGVKAVADVALLGGDARGFAGLFLLREEPGGASRVVFGVAVRPDGSRRAFRSSSPLEPVGGKGWVTGGKGSVAGYRRLGVATEGDEVIFSIDGAVIERRALAARGSADGVSGSAGGAASWQVGIAQRGIAARWRRLVARAPGGEALDPDRLVPWGGAAEARGALTEAGQHGQAFVRKPDLRALRALGACLDEAARACAAGGEPSLRAEIAGEAARLASRTHAAARQARGATLHAEVFALIDGAGPATAGDPALPPRAVQRLEALRLGLRPLRMEARLPPAPRGRLLDPLDLGAILRASYGGLDRAGGAELVIEVRVDRARQDSESHEAERALTVSGKASAEEAALEAELGDLQGRLPEELLDARGRATVLRAGAEALGPQTLRDLRTFQIGGQSYELHVDDGKALLEAHQRVRELQERLAGARGGSSTRVKVPATLHSTSILLELSYWVELDGKRLVDVSKERTYLGIEQWSHPADAQLGVPASRVDEGRIQAAVESVRRRALARFRNAVAIESLYAKLDGPGRLDLAARLARATRLGEHVSRLAWILKAELGLEGEALEAATRKALD